MIDIGGGSTELVCGAGGRLGFHVSTQIGVVRHSERHLRSDPPAPAELDALAADVEAGVAAAVTADVRERVRAAVAVAGTATSCAAIDLALERFDTAKVEGHVLSRAKLDRMLARLAKMTLAQRREVVGLHPDRAPTIVAGVVVLSRVLDAFGLAEVEVSDRDLLWGVALELARDASPGTAVNRRRYLPMAYGNARFWTFVLWRLIDTGWILDSSVRAVVPPAVVPRHIDPGDCRINRRLPPPGSLKTAPKARTPARPDGANLKPPRPAARRLLA